MFVRSKIKALTPRLKNVCRPQKKFEKSSCQFPRSCHAASMFKTTDHYKIVQSNKLPQHLEKELKYILDKLNNPEYLRAMEKLAQICSKQNFLYN